MFGPAPQRPEVAVHHPDQDAADAPPATRLDTPDDEPIAELGRLPNPARALMWTLVSTLAATVLVFALVPATVPTGALVTPAASWPARYLDWLWSLASLRFLDGWQASYGAFAMVQTPQSVCVTILVALAAHGLVTIIAIAPLPAGGPRRPPGAWLAAAAVAGIALLGWISSTLAVLADWLNAATGATLLPTVVSPPPVWRSAESFGLLVGFVRQLVFPVLVLAVALTPAAIWWWRRRWPGIAQQQRLGTVFGRLTRLMSGQLPVFVAAALLVEVATASFGASQLLLGGQIRQWFDDRPSNVATGLLLLGILVAVIRYVVEKAGQLLSKLIPAPSDLDKPGQEQHEATNKQPDDLPLEPIRGLWRRVRSDRAARTAVALLAAVAVAVCYSRLWFDFRLGDIVSTDAPAPPSARHWLGVDVLGHDQLVRIGAAVVGSLAIAAGAATLATLGGLVLLALGAWLPRRFSVLLADLGAVAAAVWLLRSFVDPLSRLELVVVLGVAGLSVTIRLMSNRGNGLVAPIAEAWLVTCSAATAAEVLSTMLLVRLGGGAPTLGESLATASRSFDVELFGTPVASTWPWLWYPPAALTTVLAVAFTLLAVAVLRGALPRGAAVDGPAEPAALES